MDFDYKEVASMEAHMPREIPAKKIKNNTAHTEALANLAWVEGRYDAEVTKRPVHNKDRHTLDVTWKQALKRARARVEATRPIGN